MAPSQAEAMVRSISLPYRPHASAASCSAAAMSSVSRNPAGPNRANKLKASSFRVVFRLWFASACETFCTALARAAVT